MQPPLSKLSRREVSEFLSSVGKITRFLNGEPRATLMTKAHFNEFYNRVIEEVPELG